jgi:hypothetical protein
MERITPEEYIRLEQPQDPNQQNTEDTKIVYVVNNNQSFDQAFRLTVLLAIVVVMGLVVVKK